MGQAVAITLNDGATTPVGIVFSPEKQPDGTIGFVDRRKTSRALQPSILLRQSPPNGKRSTVKIGYEVVYPIEGLVNNVPAPIATARFVDGVFVIPDIMSTTDRAHLHAFASNFAAHAAFKAAVKDGDYVI